MLAKFAFTILATLDFAFSISALLESAFELRKEILEVESKDTHPLSPPPQREGDKTPCINLKTKV